MLQVTTGMSNRRR